MKILGINDDVTTCECCGKSELKCTVILSSDDGMEQVYYGRDCAAKALSPYRPKTAYKIEQEARGIQNGYRKTSKGWVRIAV